MVLTLDLRLESLWNKLEAVKCKKPWFWRTINVFKNTWWREVKVDTCQSLRVRHHQLFKTRCTKTTGFAECLTQVPQFFFWRKKAMVWHCRNIWAIEC